MALTEHQEELIQVLKAFGVGKEDILVIVLHLETDEMAKHMIDWMVATRDQDKSLGMLLRKAVELRKTLSKM